MSQNGENQNKIENSTTKRLAHLGVKVALIYMVFGMLWIFFSDLILHEIVKDLERYKMIQSYKGYAFVLITVAVIYFEIQGLTKRIKKDQKVMREARLELEKTNYELKEREFRYSFAMENASEGIFEWDILNDKAYFPVYWQRLLGLDLPTINDYSKFWFSKIYYEDYLDFDEALSAHLSRKTDYYRAKYRVEINGSLVWIEAKGKAIFEDERPIRMIGSHSDITNQKTTEKRITELAYYDMKTNLPNEANAKIYFEEMVLNYECIDVIHLDIRDFKHINDSYSREVGDELLNLISKKIIEAFDLKSVLAKIGVDEFLLLLPSRYNEGLNEKEIDLKIREVTKEPFKVRDIICRIDLCYGMSQYPKDATNFDRLLRAAELALHEVKQSKEIKGLVYTKELEYKRLREIEISRKIKEAIERKQLFMHYQAWHNQDGIVKGYEALIRWRDEEGRLIYPNEFLQAAKSHGLMGQIDLYVFERVLEDIKKLEPMEVSINLSSMFFEMPDGLDKVISLIEKSGVNPSSIRVEVTESEAILNIEKAKDILEGFSKMGVKVWVDDFGVGYSSFRYLFALPIDAIKLDRSFITCFLEDDKKMAIVKNMIFLAHDLNLKVVSEGIEKDTQLRILKMLGCDYYQGFYLHRPEGLIKLTKKD